MKSLTILFMALALGAADVLELGDSSFDAQLEELDTALVMFYAPWCGHCKKLKPEFDKAAKDLANNDPPVYLAKVDCTEAGKDTCGRFDISGYPTLKIFRGGEVSSDYNGPRDASGIVKFMKAQVGPASKEITDDGDFKKYIENVKEVVIVGNLEDSSDMDIFQKLASKMRESTQFAHSKATSGVRKAGIYLHRPKHLHNKFEENFVKYDGKVTKDALEAWIKDNYHGLVAHRTIDNAPEFQGKDTVVAFYEVDYVRNAKMTNYWRNRILKVAKELNSKGLHYAVSNKHDFMAELQEYGLDEVVGEDKVIITLKNAKGLKFVMEDKFDMENFKKFLQEYEAGNLEPYMKSEPIPESNDAGVKVAVAKNFDELVSKSDKDVLIEFYAPWCGHCKKLVPIYDDLGEKMAGEDVLIVKMDATANDVPPEFEVRGFPTLFWVKKGEKPVSYNGGREVDDFVKYIAQHSTKELNKFDRKGNAKKTEL